MSYRISRFSLKMIAKYEEHDKFIALGMPLELLHGQKTYGISKDILSIEEVSALRGIPKQLAHLDG